jgi:hypothetical protein
MQRKNSVDQSASKLLIYMSIVRGLADFTPIPEGGAGERTALERAKLTLDGATEAKGEVRSLPH